jgi:hypothetical protein
MPIKPIPPEDFKPKPELNEQSGSFARVRPREAEEEARRLQRESNARFSMIIDPPVGPYSPKEKIQEWITDLQARRERSDTGTREQYDRAITEAQSWLDQLGK